MAKLTDAAAIRKVLGLPIFGDLDAKASNRIRRVIRVERLDAGTCFLIEEDLNADDLFIVLQGEVALTVEDRLLILNDAPALIGLLSLIDEAPRTASATAFSDIVLAVLPRKEFQDLMALSPRFARNVIEHLARDVRNLHRADERVRLNFDDHFDSPNARLVPGPYAMEDVDLRLFLMHGSPSSLVRWMPPGVKPLPGLEDRWFLISGYYPRFFSLHPNRHAKPVAYSETAPYVPCLLPDGSPALFCLEAYPDNYMAIFLGRELYGIPRRFGRTSYGDSHIDLNVDNRLILRAGWRGSTPCETPEVALVEALGGAAAPDCIRQTASALMKLLGAKGHVDKAPALPVLVRKQVPDVQKSDGDRQRIDELITLPIRVNQVSNFRRLEDAYVRRFAHDWMVGGRCAGAFRFRATMTIGHTSRVRDYISAERRTKIRISL